MPYRITPSTEILTLTEAPFLFTLVGVLSKYAIWCKVCRFFCSLRKKSYAIPLKGTDVHIQQLIHQKDLNICLPSYYYARVIVQLLWENTNKKFRYVMLFIMRPSSILRFQFFFFLVSMNVSEQFFLTKFSKFLVLYLVCTCMTFDFTSKITSYLIMLMNKKSECKKDHQTCSKILKAICKNEV